MHVIHRTARAGALVAFWLIASAPTHAGDRVITMINDPVTPETGGHVFFDILAGPGPAATVQFTTVDGTATVADNDYFPFSGTLTFPASPGPFVASLGVFVMFDGIYEADETFSMVISNPSAGASIADGEGIATILNNDPPPGIGVRDASASEGDAGARDVLVPVSFEPLFYSGLPTTVGFETADGTAQAGLDYLATSGTLSLAPGETVRYVTVSVLGDSLDEDDETFFVNLTSVTGAVITDPQSVVTIRDDEARLELAHGSMLRRVLGPSPAGLPGHVYRIAQQSLSSYEVVVDEASGDLAPVRLQLIAGDGSTVLRESEPIGSGTARSLRWTNTRTVDETEETVRVTSGGCASDCGVDDTYRIRAFDVTFGIPRFNNAGSQVTVLILQNPGDGAVLGTVHFWDSTGGLLASQDFGIPAKGTVVLETFAIPGLSGTAGSMSVVHQARYGGLTGKAVALEPATGFSFDTPLFPRLK